MYVIFSNLMPKWDAILKAGYITCNPIIAIEPNGKEKEKVTHKKHEIGEVYYFPFDFYLFFLISIYTTNASTIISNAMMT